MDILHGDVHNSDLEVGVLCGTWTMQSKGVPCDASKGQAKSHDCKEWCTQHGLTMSLSVYHKACGETMAHVLCQEWCRKMQYLYDVHLSHPGSVIAWLAVAHAFPAHVDYERSIALARNHEVDKRALAIRSLMPA